MKKIIIYYSKTGWGRAIYYALAQGFKQCGQEVILLDVDKDTYLQDLTEALKNNDIYFSLGHNEEGLNVNVNTGKGLYTELNIPHVCILDDAPYNTVTFNTKAVECNHLILCVRDKSHLECLNMDNFKSNIKMSAFIPFGASVDVIDGNFKKKRDIDVIYSATYYGMPNRGWRRYFFKRKLLNEVADYLEENAVTVLDGFKTVLELRGLNEPEILKKYYNKYFTMLYEYIKTYRRVKCVEKIADSGIIIDVCDSSWENVSFSKKLRIHGTTYYESLELYKRSKILLQEMAEFNSGSHNRVFDATLSGAAIVSEYSSYLGTKFENGVDIEYFNWNNIDKMPRIVESLLENENRRNTMVHNAYNKVLKEHMPVHRASKILEIVDSYLSSRYGNLYKKVTK